MLDQIEKDSRILALESQCGAPSMESVLEYLPKFVGSLTTYFNDWRKSMSQTKGMPAMEMPHDFIRAISKTTYTDFRTVNLFIPEGLKVSYLHYSQALESMVKVLESEEQGLLVEYAKWLGEGVGRPSALASVTGTLSSEASLKAIEDAEAQIQACFQQGGQLQHEAPYPNVIGRQGDWAPVCSALVALGERVNSATHVRMIERMNHINDLLETLMRRIGENTGEYQVSELTLQKLARYSYACARFFESYGLLRYRLETYQFAVEGSIQKLSEFVK